MTDKHNNARSRRLRLGMVGGGRDAFIGAVHRMAARLDDRYELVAGCFSSTAEKSRASAADLGVAADRAYDDFEAMAAAETARDDGIDVVSIVTPNHVHFSAAKAFLDAGIHVICDKPMTTSLEDAEALASLVDRTGLIFVLTHNYTGYPMIRHARAMVQAGEIGKVRVVQAEYPQDWLSRKLEDTGLKQAAWRTDPAKSGPAGALGDIGTHAFNLACFVTGLRLDAVMADVSTFVEGRKLDDNVHVLTRWQGGARGMIWASQVAPGNENALKLRVYGETGALEWHQEDPNYLLVSKLGEPRQRLTRGMDGLVDAAKRATRIPPGHPEGYLEGFATIYADAAELITARLENREPDPEATTLPSVRDGVDGVKFITDVLASAQAGGVWT
ncbi:MAG: Gfo/Idh/MocA family protein [Geminicoccaceae bacterium]